MLRKIFLVLLVLAFLAFIHERVLTAIGSFLVEEDNPEYTDAAVVLYTGVDIYPRLIEAANLYKNKKIGEVVINGNRKTDILRSLENSGYEPPCQWYAEQVAILTFLDVPKDHIVAVSAENAFDTISEAEVVGKTLLNNGMTSVSITTSKFHSRRARHIWSDMYRDRIRIFSIPAKSDPFNPRAWWKSGRQIRWVLSEYGAWIYYYMMKILR